MPNTTITLTTVKELISTWEDKGNALYLRVTALENNDSYEKLKGRNGQSPPDLTGTSAKEVPLALRLITAVIIIAGDLAKVISQARKLLEQFEGRNKLLRSDSDLVPIYNLLTTDPIEIEPFAMGSDSFAKLTPTGKRTKVNIDDAHEGMVADLTKGEAVILLVDKTWLTLRATLGKYQTRIGELHTIADGLGISAVTELPLAEAAILEAIALLDGNPLGADNTITAQVEPAVSAAAARVGAFQQEFSELARALNAAERKFTQIETTSQRCNVAWTNCERRVADVTTQTRIEAARFQKLRTWLSAIERKRHTTPLADSRTKLTNWNSEADEVLRAEEAALTYYEGLLAERRGLVARLTAFTGQAKSRGISEDTSLKPLADEARTLLGAGVRTPLARVRDLIERYAQYL